MKNFKNLLLISFAMLIIASCTRIDAGYEGILVKQFGSGKGVQNVSQVTGRVFYNPFNYDVFEFPTFVQTADYSAFSANSMDGSIFEIDPIVSYRVIPGKVLLYLLNTEEILKIYKKQCF